MTHKCVTYRRCPLHSKKIKTKEKLSAFQTGKCTFYRDKQRKKKLMKVLCGCLVNSAMQQTML